MTAICTGYSYRRTYEEMLEMADHCFISTKKVISHPGKTDMPAATMIEKSMGHEWIRELANIPIQRIITEGRFR